MIYEYSTYLLSFHFDPTPREKLIEIVALHQPPGHKCISANWLGRARTCVFPAGGRAGERAGARGSNTLGCTRLRRRRHATVVSSPVARSSPRRKEAGVFVVVQFIGPHFVQCCLRFPRIDKSSPNIPQKLKKIFECGRISRKKFWNRVTATEESASH